MLVAALALLASALWQQRRLVAHARRFAWLLFVVGFVGYAAQAQLSIVNVTGVVQALRAGRGLGFLMFDPLATVLWSFVLVSLVIWGAARSAAGCVPSARCRNSRIWPDGS